MTEYYKGERIAELLEIIDEMESRLNNLTRGEDYSLAQYEEVAQGYTSLALAKAKLTALKGENHE
jgi:hypothetical protein